MVETKTRRPAAKLAALGIAFLLAFSIGVVVAANFTVQLSDAFKFIESSPIRVVINAASGAINDLFHLIDNIIATANFGMRLLDQFVSREFIAITSVLKNPLDVFNFREIISALNGWKHTLQLVTQLGSTQANMKRLIALIVQTAATFGFKHGLGLSQQVATPNRGQTRPIQLCYVVMLQSTVTASNCIPIGGTVAPGSPTDQFNINDRFNAYCFPTCTFGSQQQAQQNPDMLTAVTNEVIGIISALAGAIAVLIMAVWVLHEKFHIRSNTFTVVILALVIEAESRINLVPSWVGDFTVVLTIIYILYRITSGRGRGESLEESVED